MSTMISGLSFSFYRNISYKYKLYKYRRLCQCRSQNSNNKLINSALSDNFVKYITKRAKIVKIKDDEKAIQDTLYLNKADSILIIPENFGSNLLIGQEPNIKIKKSTQNISEYTELLVNRYFKMADNYSKVGMSESEIIRNIEKDFQNEIEVKVSNEEQSDIEKLAIYYSFENIKPVIIIYE